MHSEGKKRRYFVALFFGTGDLLRWTLRKTLLTSKEELNKNLMAESKLLN
jgi:hypothetical protein